MIYSDKVRPRIECMDELAILLRDIRRALHITQPELAYRSGVSLTHLSHIEILKVRPSIIALNKVAKALGYRIVFQVEKLNENILDN